MERNTGLITQLLFMLICFSANADDHFKSQGIFTQYKLYKHTTESLTIRVKYNVLVDSCNIHNLVGNFEKVIANEPSKPESGASNALQNFIITAVDSQKYIANFAIISTLAHCNSKNTKVFESKSLTLNPIDGTLNVEILIPENYEIDILKN